MTLAERRYKKPADYTTLIQVKEEPNNYTRKRPKTNGNVSPKLFKRIPLERLMDLKIDYAFKQLFWE